MSAVDSKNNRRHRALAGLVLMLSFLAAGAEAGVPAPLLNPPQAGSAGILLIAGAGVAP